jgi:hypothetical protein
MPFQEWSLLIEVSLLPTRGSHSIWDTDWVLQWASQVYSSFSENTPSIKKETVQAESLYNEGWLGKYNFPIKKNYRYILLKKIAPL